MKATLVLNRDAGTLKSLDVEQTADEIAEIFRGRGHDVTIEIAAGEDVVATIRRACAASGVDAVVIGGGDGTVSAAAAAAAECGVALGILPLGTMNFFARSLEIPADLKDATEALAGGIVAEADIATVNGRVFVHTVALGLHPAMVEEREKVDYGSRYGKMIGSLHAWLRVVQNPRRFTVSIAIDGKRVDRRTAGIVVSNNPLGEGHLPYADRLDGGRLAVYVTSAHGWLQLARVTASVGLGTAADHPLVEVFETSTTEIAAGTRAIPATIDGELANLPGPLRIDCVPAGLRVLKPRKPAD
jgi:diacylglycerol kinase family enzyme